IRASCSPLLFGWRSILQFAAARRRRAQGACAHMPPTDRAAGEPGGTEWNAYQEDCEAVGEWMVARFSRTLVALLVGVTVGLVILPSSAYASAANPQD